MILGKKYYFHKVNFQESRIKLKIIFRNLTSFHKIKFHVYLFIMAYDSQRQVMDQKLSKRISLIRPQTIVHWLKTASWIGVSCPSEFALYWHDGTNNTSVSKIHAEFARIRSSWHSAHMSQKPPYVYKMFNSYSRSLDRPRKLSR